MPENEPHSVTFQMNFRYHCAPNGVRWTLCGLRALDIAWDPPGIWQTKETSSSMSGHLPKCEACLASEALPLALLGDLP
jgi:hypothetical protein